MIHDLILDRLQELLQAALIDDIPVDDPARAGIVLQGPLQGNPDPDAAGISVTLHENDPDGIYKPGNTNMTGEWVDEVAEVECGASITWKRRFCVKARCLLTQGQDLATARSIASTVRSRIETTLLTASFSSVLDPDTGEFVSKRVLSDAIQGEMTQAGGPEAYDYHIKIRFQVETTRGVQP
jgi:hypothetical protein